MNSQITFVCKVYNLDSSKSSEEIGVEIERKIDELIGEVINTVADNQSWIYELETFVKDNIELSEQAKLVFDVNDISVEDV